MGGPAPVKPEAGWASEGEVGGTENSDVASLSSHDGGAWLSDLF